MNHIWKFADKEIYCDVFDPDCYERIDGALKSLSSELSHMEYSKDGERGDIADRLRRNCEVIEGFFDRIFGEDARKTLFDGERNIMTFSGALASFLCYIDGEIAYMAESGEKIKAQLTERLAAL